MRSERELMMIMKIGIHDDGGGDKIPGPRVSLHSLSGIGEKIRQYVIVI